MAVLEPMVLGRPVIATRMGGIPEQIRDGVDGVLVDAGDERSACRRPAGAGRRRCPRRSSGPVRS